MLSILVPTLGNRKIELKRLLDSLDKQTTDLFEVICAIQDNHREIAELLSEYKMKIKVCNLYQRGLSYARNRAMDLIDPKATMITFSDDDCWYPNYLVDKVLSKFANKTCICYQIFDPIANEFYKDYPQLPNENLSKRDSLKVSSIEIFIPRTVLTSDIKFDENFGLGTPNPSGEENIFLFDLLKHGYKISYIPESIVYHLKPNWISKEYIFKGKGALFARLYSKKKAYLMIVIYAYMKRNFSTNLKNDLANLFKEVFNYNRNSC